MDVRCEKCGSEYELDDAKVTTQGVSVKCTSCGNVFKVTKAQAAARSPTTGEWMIRQANGQVFKFKELTTLQRWIVERRVLRDDEISKNGDTWKRLGDIFELASFFQVAEQASIAPQQGQGMPPGAILATAPGMPGLAPEGMRQQVSTIDDPEPVGRSGASVIITVTLVAAGLIGGVFLARKQIADWIRGPAPKAAPNPSAELADGHVRTALKEMRKDSFAGFSVAEQEFEKALSLNPNQPQALAGATATLAAAAEYSREEAQDIDTTIKAAAAGKIKIGTAELATMADDLSKKRADAATRTERAFAYMKRTLEADPSGESGVRAASRYYALTNAQEAFKSIADKAQQMGMVEEPEFVYALALLRSSDEAAQEAAIALFQKVLEKDPEHIGARYHLAELLAKRADKDRALTMLNEVLKVSPDHTRAQALKTRLEGPKAPDKPPDATDKPPEKPAVESFADLLNKANGARQRERIKQAVDLYEKALGLRPDNSEALTGLGFCFLDLEQPGNAIAQFQKALSANSRYSDAHMGLAEAYKAKGQKRDAIKHYQRYLELAPEGNEAAVAKTALKELGQGE